MHPTPNAEVAAQSLLARELALRGLGEVVQQFADRRQGRFVQLSFHRLFADHALIRQAHSVGAQYASQRMHQNAGHA